MVEHSALFVCYANICRSPIAEACFKELLQQKRLLNKWRVESAATSDCLVGTPPDQRGQACMNSHNIHHHIKSHRARQVTLSDYENFDYILCMDNNNMRELQQMAPQRAYKAKLLLIGKFDNDSSTHGIVRDPYLSLSASDFEFVYQQLWRSCKRFLQEVS